MLVTITIKMEAETQGELINTFGSTVQQYKRHIEELHLGNVLGPPQNVELRFLIIGGTWRDLPDVTTTAEQPTQVPGEVPDVPNGVPDPGPSDVLV